MELSCRSLQFRGLTSKQIRGLATQLSEHIPPSLVPSPELWHEPSNYGLPPPSYDDTIADVPPDYTSTDALASAQTPEYTPYSSLNPSLCSDVPNCLRLSRDSSPTSSLYLDNKSFYADIDFGFCEEGVKSHAPKKRNKNNASKKPPQQEEKKDEAPPPPADSGGGGGEDAPGGGDPPGDGAGGAGGGDDGNGGDGGNGGTGDGVDGAGDTAGKKKKKKGKKAQEEEEAEKKRKEAEEAEAAAEAERKRIEEEEAERKKVEEDAAAAAAAAAATTTTAANDLSWADPAAEPAGDDWGSFAATETVGKKKKGKRGKVGINLGC